MESATPSPHLQDLTVFRIPPEIISKVLVELSWSHWDEEVPETWTYHPAPWLAVTQVCQRWRRIAVSDPNLWRRIKVFLPNDPTYATNFVDQEYKTWLIREILCRSKELPLTIEIHGEPASRSTLAGRDVLKPVMENAHRIKDLTFLYSLAFYALYSDFFGSHFSNLECLAVENVERLDQNIPPVFTSSQFPRLRTVDVTGLPLTSLSGLFRPSIIRIHLIHSQFTYDPTLYSTLCNYLENTPSLEFLSLHIADFALPPPDAEWPTVTTRVGLPKLECLWFSCNTPNPSKFFDRVTIPTQTQLTFRLLPIPPVGLDLEDAKTFVTEISEHQVRAQRLTSIELYSNSHDAADGVILETCTGFKVDIAVSGASKSQLAKILFDAPTVPPLSSIRFLRLGDLGFTCVTEITHLLGPLKGVEEVQMEGPQRTLFLQALAESCSSEDSVLFPELEAVALWEVGKDELKAIRSWLEHRLDADYRLQVLSFVDSPDVTCEDAEDLENVVGQVFFV